MRIRCEMNSLIVLFLSSRTYDDAHTTKGEKNRHKQAIEFVYVEPHVFFSRCPLAQTVYTLHTNTTHHSAIDRDNENRLLFQLRFRFGHTQIVEFQTNVRTEKSKENCRRPRINAYLIVSRAHLPSWPTSHRQYCLSVSSVERTINS